MERSRLYFLSPGNLARCLNKCLREKKALRAGKQVHALLLTSETDTTVLSLSSKLVAMYASCGDLNSAKLVLGETRRPNVFAFNWMVFASAFNGDCEAAIRYFSAMRRKGIFGNKFTFSILLKACIGLVDLNRGKEIHCVATQMGFESDVSVGNVLIDMYCKCGSIDYARKVFDKMPERDPACWTSMICGYFGAGEPGLADGLFERMKSEGKPEPNDFTWNAVIVGHARSGDSGSVFSLLDRMRREGKKSPDSVTWTAVISGLVQSRRAFEALEAFRVMLISGAKPTQVTFSSLLPICPLINSVRIGKQIHGSVYRTGLEINPFVACSLVDAYSKCGDLNSARVVFENIRAKNVALWNAMIACYARHGMFESSLGLFERMVDGEGFGANEVTLVSVLSSCSHGGFVERGLDIFSSMRERHGIEPGKEHYSCVIDLLCRSGKIEEAYDVVKGLPVGLETESIVGAFFHGCRVHERRDLAKKMSEGILGMKKLRRPGGFVTLSNIHAGHGDWEEVGNVRQVMKENKVNKIPGFSWLEKKD